MTLHGDTRIDNYYWLRDDERARPDVLEYLHAENAYGKQVMDSQLSLQERLLKEIIDRIVARSGGAQRLLSEPAAVSPAYYPVARCSPGGADPGPRLSLDVSGERVRAL